MKQTSSFPAEAFDTWADVYDSQPNPLLALEQRLLGPMLPDVRGLDVLDAGCGTGRWLHQLAGQSPRSLLGADISSQMLLLAAAKLGHNCDLRLGSCTALPFNNGVADMVLSCFVISYVDDLETFAKEIDRVANHPRLSGALLSGCFTRRTGFQFGREADLRTAREARSL